MDLEEQDAAEKAQELSEKAEQVTQHEDEKHAALLEAAKEGEDVQLEDVETVELGEVTIEAKTGLSGNVARLVDVFYDDQTAPGTAIDAAVEILANQTVRMKVEGFEWAEDDEYFKRFYDDYIGENDMEKAAETCMETVVEKPCDLEDERQQEAVESFHQDGQGNSDWVRSDGNRGHSDVPPAHRDATSPNGGDRDGRSKRRD